MDAICSQCGRPDPDALAVKLAAESEASAVRGEALLHWRTELERLRTQRDAVLALHREVGSVPRGPGPDHGCSTCGSIGFPCPTRRALEETEARAVPLPEGKEQ